MPCAAAFAAVVDRLETSVPSIIDQVPAVSSSIWQSWRIVATGASTALFPKERLEPRKQGIFAVEHVVERGHRNGLRAMIAQETSQRVELRRRTMQRQHAR